jgi:hypothetical protein
MGLKEVQEELKAQIKEAEEREKTEEVVETPVEEVKPDVVEPAEEPKKEPEKVEEEVKKTNAEQAAERKAKRRREEVLAAELAAANARIAELSRPKEETKPVVEDVVPNKEDDPQAYLEHKVKKAEKIAEEAAEIARKANEKLDKSELRNQKKTMIEQAQGELMSYEDSVRKNNPEYDEAKKWYANMLAFSIKNLNPKITDKALVDAVNHQVLLRASQFINDGYENPVEALYEEVKQMGFKAQPKEEVKKEPNLDKVAANRARNAGTAGAAGSSGQATVTRQAAASMPVQEWARMSKAERQRLLKSAH